MLGVSLRARRHTTQVMLGLSVRAKWDTTLVYIINNEPNQNHIDRCSSVVVSMAACIIEIAYGCDRRRA